MSDSLVTKQQNTDKCEERLIRTLMERAEASLQRFNTVYPAGTVGSNGQTYRFPVIPDIPKHKKVAANRMTKVTLRYTTVFNGTETVRKGQQKTSLSFNTV